MWSGSFTEGKWECRVVGNFQRRPIQVSRKSTTTAKSTNFLMGATTLPSCTDKRPLDDLPFGLVYTTLEINSHTTTYLGRTIVICSLHATIRIQNIVKYTYTYTYTRPADQCATTLGQIHSLKYFLAPPNDITTTTTYTTYTNDGHLRFRLYL